MIDVNSRIERLERSNRRMKLLLLVLPLLAIGGMFTAYRSGPQEEIVAQSIKVVDKIGRPVITMQAGDNGGELSVNNYGGGSVFWANCDVLGNGVVMVSDAKGNTVWRTKPYK